MKNILIFNIINLSFFYHSIIHYYFYDSIAQDFSAIMITAILEFLKPRKDLAYIWYGIVFTGKNKINIDLLLAADKYNIPDLVKICVNHLKTNLTEVNAVDIMAKSYMINQKELFDAARKFVQFCKNSGKPVEMEALEELKETNPTLALKMLSQAMFHTETTTSRDTESKKLLIFSTIHI